MFSTKWKAASLALSSLFLHHIHAHPGHPGISLARRELDKPVIDPGFYDNLNAALMKVMGPTSYTIEAIDNGYIPTDCKNMAASESPALPATEIQVFQVIYSDCSAPWFLCRHKDAPNSQASMAEMFGRLPLRMRSYIKHILSVPGAASAYNSDNSILLRGNDASNMSPLTLYGHETGHSLDSNAYGLSTEFSKTQTWLDAYNADPNVCQDYARASQQENYAQMINVALYDQNAAGGISNIASNWKKIGNQLAAINDYIGNTLKPGGQCTSRLSDSVWVAKSNSAKLVKMGERESKRYEGVEVRDGKKVRSDDVQYDEHWNAVFKREEEAVVPVRRTVEKKVRSEEVFYDENWNAIRKPQGV